ncbi:hypothetical protein V500_10137 [Pseudogymnoascus sp. VKM F-4518 (FW-2643)]|nr:hypothetical protein V500_10137 [Pseudogymnoascus sp. VKM F-4518 (FW-2643)]
MYNGYMVQLVRLLSRPSMYEATVLKSLIERTLRLRAARGIEANPLGPTDLRPQTRVDEDETPSCQIQPKPPLRSNVPAPLRRLLRAPPLPLDRPRRVPGLRFEGSA